MSDLDEPVDLDAIDFSAKDKNEDGSLRVVSAVGIGSRNSRKKYNDCDKVVILERMSDGELLSDICKDYEFKPYTVWLWCLSDPDFSKEYLKAKKFQALKWCDDLVKIADDDEYDSYVDEAGKPTYNYQHIQRAKMRLGMRQHLIKAALPELFGDKVEVDHKGSLGSEGVKVDAPPLETREEWEARQRKKLGMDDE